jgi:hypothetical protein
VLTEYGIWPAESKDARDYANLGRALYDADLLMGLLKDGSRPGDHPWPLPGGARQQSHGGHSLTAGAREPGTPTRTMPWNSHQKPPGAATCRRRVSSPTFAVHGEAIEPPPPCRRWGALAAISGDEAACHLTQCATAPNYPHHRLSGSRDLVTQTW